MKPFKGHMKDWYKVKYSRKITKEYGPNLGWIACGTFVDHPEFGYSRGSHTSLIVKCAGPNESGDYEVETLNSRYVLIGDPIP